MFAPPGSDERFGPVAPLARAGYITGETMHVDGGTHAAAGWYHHPETGEYSLGPSA